MNYAAFEARAREIFDQVPVSYREGVDGLEVSRATVPHPSLPEVYTLGECKSEHYPSEFGGPGEVRSVVVLYYGSFQAVSLQEEDWDWEGEIWETVTHEIRHHLESLALEDDLEELDYAEDQNFARREGESFDPFFYHFGMDRGGGEWEVDGDRFLEVPLDRSVLQTDEPLRLRWRERELRVPRPAQLGDVHFLRLEGLEPDAAEGEVIAVLLPRRGLWGWLRAILRPRPLEVLHSEVVVQGEDGA